MWNVHFIDTQGVTRVMQFEGRGIHDALSNAIDSGVVESSIFKCEVVYYEP